MPFIFIVPCSRFAQYAQQSVSIQTNADLINIRMKAMVLLAEIKSHNLNKQRNQVPDTSITNSMVLFKFYHVLFADATPNEHQLYLEFALNIDIGYGLLQ